MAFRFPTKRSLTFSYFMFHGSTLFCDYGLQLLHYFRDLINASICLCSFCLELHRHLNLSVEKKKSNYDEMYE